MPDPRDPSSIPGKSARQAVINPASRIQHVDDILGFNQIPTASSKQRALLAARQYSPSGIRPQGPFTQGQGNGLWFMDIETLGLDSASPVTMGSVMSRSGIESLSGNLQEKMIRSGQFDESILPGFGSAGGKIKGLHNLAESEWDDLVRSIDNATDSAGNNKLKDIMAGQSSRAILDEAKQTGRHPADVLLSKMRETRKAEDFGALFNAKKTNKRAGDWFAKKIKMISDHGGGTLVVHNLPFESRIMSTRFTDKGYKTQVEPYLYASSIQKSGKIDKRMYSTSKEVSRLSDMLHIKTRAGVGVGDTGKQLFQAVKSHISTPADGYVKLLDSRDIMRSVNAMAEEQGFLSSIGVTRGSSVDDFLQALDPNLKEFHLPSADDVATEALLSHQMQAGELLAKGDKEAKKQLQSKFGDYFKRLDIIRTDSRRAEKYLVERLSNQIANTLAGKDVRLMEGNTINGVFVPTVNAYEGTRSVYDPNVGKKVAETYSVHRPKYSSSQRTIDELFEYNWNATSKYHRKNISRKRYDAIRDSLKPILEKGEALDDAGLLLQKEIQTLISKGDDVSIKGIEAIIAKQSTKAMGSATKAAEAASRFSKAKWLGVGVGIGLAATMLWEGNPERNTERMTSINRGGSGSPTGSAAIGGGLAVAGIAGALKAGKGSPASYGAVLAGGYALASGVHDVLNDNKSSDWGGSLGAGITAAAFGGVAYAGAGGLGKLGRPEFLSKVDDMWKGLGGQRMGFAAAGIIGAGLIASYMLDDNPEVSNPMSEASHRTHSDFGSPYKGRRVSAAIGGLFEDVVEGTNKYIGKVRGGMKGIVKTTSLKKPGSGLIVHNATYSGKQSVAKISLLESAMEQTASRPEILGRTSRLMPSVDDVVPFKRIAQKGGLPEMPSKGKIELPLPPRVGIPRVQGSKTNTPFNVGSNGKSRANASCMY